MLIKSESRTIETNIRFMAAVRLKPKKGGRFMLRFKLCTTCLALLVFFIFLGVSSSFAQWKYDGKWAKAKWKDDSTLVLMRISEYRGSPLINFQTVLVPVEAEKIIITIDQNQGWEINNFMARRASGNVNVYSAKVNREFINALKNGQTAVVKFHPGSDLDWGSESYKFSLDGSYKAITNALQ